jgi:peptidoglycan/LPS O-acetylase OafA/YrhL
MLLLVHIDRGSFWGPGPFSYSSFLASLFLVQGWIGSALAWNNPAWSLSAEWLAYVFFLISIRAIWLVRGKALSVILVLAALAPLYFVVYRMPHPSFDHAEKVGILRCLSEFSAGALLCRFLEAVEFGAIVSDLIFATGALLLTISRIEPALDGIAPPAFALLILASEHRSRLAKFTLANTVAIFFGEISFSIYLTHEILFRSALNFGPSDMGLQRIVLICAACLTIPLSWLTWRFIELPGQLAGKRFTRISP